MVHFLDMYVFILYYVVFLYVPDKVVFVQRRFFYWLKENSVNFPPLGGTICTEHNLTRGHYDFMVNNVHMYTMFTRVHYDHCLIHLH